MFRRIGAGFPRLLSRSDKVEPGVGKEKDDRSPKPAADVTRCRVIGYKRKPRKQDDEGLFGNVASKNTLDGNVIPCMYRTHMPQRLDP